MAISKLGLMLFLTLVSAKIVVFTSAQCQGDMQGLIARCARFVTKQGPKKAPSQDCCNIVKKVDFTCVCKHITPQIQWMISVEKALFVATSCGKQVPHGAKCGGYRVPLSYRTLLTNESSTMTGDAQ